MIVMRGLPNPQLLLFFSPCRSADLRRDLSRGYMWRYDTNTLTEAPVFELGIGPAANLELQLRTDGVRFASSSTYNYNYYRIGADLGLRSLLGSSISSADFKLTVDHRRVPDSEKA